MVLTAAQTTAFFEGADQMGIPHDTVVQLQTEGITTVDDLEEIVCTNPTAGPAKLCVGTEGRPAARDIHKAFTNQDQLAHHCRKMLEKLRISKGIHMGDKSSTKATGKGDLPVIVEQKDGSTRNGILKDVFGVDLI